MSRSNLLFLVTGSIAAYKACEAVSRLVQSGHRVRVAATASALRFVGAPTLEGLTGEPVLSDLFAPGAALEHIRLARWADAVIVCPASAHTLNRAAAGLADDLVGALLLAHEWTKPLLVVPAMNPAMWRHPATVAAVARLQGWGARFLPPGEGRTACGEDGEGRLAEPEAIVAAVEAALARPARALRVLVTGGGTAEPIDGVRVLTNASTGRTAALIGERFARRGHAVTLLRARGARGAEGSVREEKFTTFAELDAALARLLGAEDFDAVIHAAAVGDFGVESVVVDGAPQRPGAAKLDSHSAPVLRLRPHPKLADGLRARSGAPLKIVAFKLTHGADAAAARAAVGDLFAHSGADYVVHNDATAWGEADDFPADIYEPDGTLAGHCASRTDLAEELERLLTLDSTIS